MVYTSPETRASRLMLCMTILFFLLGLSLFRLQILEGGYFRNLSEKNRLRLITLEAPRGRILDRKGTALASSRLSFNCTAVLQERPSKIKKSFELLSKLLNESQDNLLERYKKQKAGIYRSIVLAEDLPLPEAMAVEEQMHLMNGIMIETKHVRTYPLKEAAAHLTGYIGPQNPQESDELEANGYTSQEWIGREGLEKGYESYLRGYAGGLQLEVNSRGQYLKVLGVKEPKEGRDIILSIDAGLQEFAHETLHGKRGAVAVMDLESGGLLCLNSSPSYDPNLFATSRGRKDVGVYLRDELSPMMNRAIQGQYPPGSIFKIVTAFAALEARKITLNTRFQCPGFMMLGKKRFGCWREGGHGSQGFDEAFAHSCDVFFYMTGLASGPDAIHHKAVEMGFSMITGIDLPSERSGLAPSRGWKQRRKKAAWYDGDTLNFSIGQGYLQVTPIQALGMIAIVATGEKIRPHLVEKIDGVSVASLHRAPFEVKPEYLNAMRQALESVVNSDSGTGRLGRIPGVRVAGKTGTAETHKEQTHAWYVGYAPAAKPKIAFVVFLEYGGHGGVEAAGVLNPILVKAKELGYL